MSESKNKTSPTTRQAAKPLPLKLLSFMNIGKEGPETLPVAERVKKFAPVQLVMHPSQAQEQASRCGQCAIPFCSHGKSVEQPGCPLSNNIPDWLNAVAKGQLREAARLAYRTNPMPDVCGQVCPQERFCQATCVEEQTGHGAITIGAIERYIGQTAHAEGWVPKIQPQAHYLSSVGIIGSGPAAYAAALELAIFGHKVVIYERSPKPGGLLMYGIPGFKLDKTPVVEYFNLLSEGGVDIRCGVSVGPRPGETPFSKLVTRHDAIIIATGTYKPRDARLEGNAAGEVISSLDYLNAQNIRDFGQRMPEERHSWLNAKGKNVIVFGGGDTARDCLRTAVRQGAASVKSLYRGDDSTKGGSNKDLEYALDEGADVEYLVQPKAVSRNGSNGPFTIHSVRTFVKWVSGSNKPKLIETDEILVHEADMPIMAIGFEAENLPELFNIHGMRLKDNGLIDVTPIHKPWPHAPGAGLVGLATAGKSEALVYAVGDIVRGPSLVALASRDGRDIGRAVHDGIRDRGTFLRKYANGTQTMPLFELHAT